MAKYWRSKYSGEQIEAMLDSIGGSSVLLSGGYPVQPEIAGITVARGQIVYNAEDILGDVEVNKVLVCRSGVCVVASVEEKTVSAEGPDESAVTVYAVCNPVGNWIGTQEQYNALSSYDSETTYYIVADEPDTSGSNA